MPPHAWGLEQSSWCWQGPRAGRSPCNVAPVRLRQRWSCGCGKTLALPASAAWTGRSTPRRAPGRLLTATCGSRGIAPVALPSSISFKQGTAHLSLRRATLADGKEGLGNLPAQVLLHSFQAHSQGVGVGLFRVFGSLLSSWGIWSWSFCFGFILDCAVASPSCSIV